MAVTTLLTPTPRCVLENEREMMLSQLEISDIAVESDDGVHRISRRGRARRDLVGSAVVGAAESHFAFPPHKPEHGMPKAKPDEREEWRTWARILCVCAGARDGVCVSASLYEASLGRNGGLLRRTRFIGRLCLTYAVCNDTALVSAYYTRPLRAFACPLRSGTGRSWSHAPTKAVGGEPWCEGEHGITCWRAKLHVSKVAQMSEWRAAKSRTLASMRPTSACRGALWQICCGMGGGGIHVLPLTERGSFSLSR
jgi:hypothetical protein